MTMESWDEMVKLARGVDTLEAGRALPLTKLFGHFIVAQYDAGLEHAEKGSAVETALTLTIAQSRGTALLLENRHLWTAVNAAARALYVVGDPMRALEILQAAIRERVTG
jgi:hypothetical protein